MIQPHSGALLSAVIVTSARSVALKLCARNCSTHRHFAGGQKLLAQKYVASQSAQLIDNLLVALRL